MSSAQPQNSICGIYRIYCKANYECYIGSSIQIPKRWIAHRYHLRANKHVSSYLQRAWNKYEEKSFKFEVLEGCSKEVLYEREQFWIDMLRPKFNAVKIMYPYIERPKKTHCVNGHERTLESIYAGGGCKICASIRNRTKKGYLGWTDAQIKELHYAKVIAALKVRIWKRKTHCVNGHERTPDNLWGRSCKKCTLTRQQERRAELKAAGIKRLA